jgi:hypothetical protein
MPATHTSPSVTSFFTQVLNFLKTGATVTNTMTAEAEVSASVAKYCPEAGSSNFLEKPGT